MPYTIEKHKHGFAAYAAARGTSVMGCRFPVEIGRRILEATTLPVVADAVANLPKPGEFDKQHRRWRNRVIKVALKHELVFTHGVAAKLINIYLKSIFVCGGNHDHPRVRATHPPIDSILLDELYRRNFGGLRKEWQAARKARWSKLTSEQYERVIWAIQQVTPVGGGLWQIEEHWRGFQ